MRIKWNHSDEAVITVDATECQAILLLLQSMTVLKSAPFRQKFIVVLRQAMFRRTDVKFTERKERRDEKGLEE